MVGRRFYKKRIPYKKIALTEWAKEQDAEFWKQNKDLEKQLEEGSEEEEWSEEDEEKSVTTDQEVPEVEIEELKKESYRCRSAYKLIEIHEKYKLFKPGQTVVDLGCCPGSWTQVAVRATRAMHENFGSLVIGMDLQETEPIKGAKIINNIDFLEPSSQKIIKKALKNRRADVLISDMAPNTTGIRYTDHLRVSELCYSTLNFIPKVCKAGASLVMKAFDGEECKQILRDVRFLFEKGMVVHPKATRKPSSEYFYVGLKYRGNKLELPKESEPEIGPYDEGPFDQCDDTLLDYDE